MENRGIIDSARAGSTSSSDASGNLPANGYIADKSFLPYIKSLKEFGFADAETGVLSRFFSNTASVAVTHGVAASFGVKRDELSGWLRSIADTRNVFAHFGAYLSRAQMPTTPMKVRGLEVDNSTPPFIAYLIAYLLAGDMCMRDLNLDYARSMSFELQSTIAPFEKMYPEVMEELNFPPEWHDALRFAIELGKKS